jgi:hypothetical protein
MVSIMHLNNAPQSGGFTMITKRTLFRAAAAVSIVAVSCIPTYQEGVWILSSELVLGNNNTGSSPGVLIVGDGLVSGIAQAANGNGPQELANAVRFWSGRDTFVGARKDASLSHYMSETLWNAPPEEIPDPAPPLKPSIFEVGVVGFKRDLTVIALGSDDARILTTDGDRGDARYTSTDYRGQLDKAVTIALDNCKCVVLVNVADHWSNVASSLDIAAINKEIAEAVAAEPAKVRLADWKTHSAGKESWFNSPGDIYHTPAGRSAYQGFLVSAINLALNNGCSVAPAVADEPTQQVLSTPTLLPSRDAEETDELLPGAGAERGTDLRQTN